MAWRQLCSSAVKNILALSLPLNVSKIYRQKRILPDLIGDDEILAETLQRSPFNECRVPLCYTVCVSVTYKKSIRLERVSGGWHSSWGVYLNLVSVLNSSVQVSHSSVRVSYNSARVSYTSVRVSHSSVRVSHSSVRVSIISVRVSHSSARV